MQPPGSGDPNPGRSYFAQLLMNLFNGGQPFAGAGGGGANPSLGQFPAAPGSGLQGLFPAAPSGPPTDMSVAGPWGAGIDPTQTAATPATPAPATPATPPTPPRSEPQFAGPTPSPSTLRPGPVRHPPNPKVGKKPAAKKT